MRIYLSYFVLFALFISCDSSKKSDKDKEESAAIHKVIAQEVLHANQYSYVRVLENGKENWIAAPTTAIEIGKTYYYGKTMEMKDFESKDLNKTFETIYFVEKISESSEDASVPLTVNPHPQNTTTEATKPTIEKKEIAIEAIANGISIAELFKNKEKYNNTVVTIKGEVTKYNPEIMGVNWFHVQDGTDFNGEFDLTVTTAAELKIGDVVTIQGKVALNKDFGAGYVYDIIVENATLVK
ncbi:MAG: hypothetical protein P1P79_09680 [Lutibacter sp.]|nr:hypothetical protein [Lutibacter sp.]